MGHTIDRCIIYRLTRGGRLSSHDAGQGTGGCRAMIKSLQSCPKRYLLMQLARVAPPTGSLHRVYGLSLRYKRTRKRMNYCERRGQFSRTRIRRRPQAGDAVWYAPRVCTLVLFIRLVPQYEREGHKKLYQWGTTAANDPMLCGHCHQHRRITQSGTEPMPPETRKVLDVRR